MKPMQMIVLLVALSAVVFGVTFASMYVWNAPANPTDSDPDRDRPVLRVSFAATQFPPVTDPGQEPIHEVEQGRPGHHDFWYENTNDEPVQMGLAEKGCTCSEVWLCVAPEAWRKKLEEARAAQVGIGILNPLGVVLDQAERERKEKAAVEEMRRQLAGSVPASELKRLEPKITAATVPAKSFGFVRLTWDGKKSGPQLLKAVLWMQDPLRGEATLQVKAAFIEPVRIDARERDIQTMAAGDAPRKTDFHVWSSTRKNFTIKTKTDSEPFITCDAPVPLTEAELKEMNSQTPVKVIAGYRIPVTVRERTDDGKKQFEQGPFRRSITITPSDEDGDLPPLIVYLNGTIKGDVLVVTGRDDGRVDLETFPARRGTNKRIALESDTPGLELSTVKQPSFMDVELVKDPGGSGRQTWVLTIRVKPGEASGVFPRDEEGYRDTGVYLETKGENPRRIRIPVRGHATQ
jgi:hypothetical protein